jgi:flavorubredoxin
MNAAAFPALHDVPATAPERIAPDTFLIPNLAPAGDGLYLPVNSMVIRGREPVIVDTGAPLHRAQWLEKAFSVVEPEDVRWIFLSHDDGDHTGSLLDVLERCPRATLVTNFFSVERLALEKPALPLHRMRWVEPGGRLDAGDRVLHLFRPPIFDGPTTRGLIDERTRAMWIVDTFACLTPGPLDAAALDDDTLASMSAMNSAVSPWHAWLDRAAYARHVDGVERLGAQVVASAHGPVLRGRRLDDAFDRLRALAGAPIIPTPGQELLDELIATTLAEPAAA